jgi:hypothetical protein
MGLEVTFIRTAQAKDLTGLDVETLRRYRASGVLVEGVHWVRVNDRVVLFNKALLLDWIATRGVPKSEQAHQEMVQAYLADLPSSQYPKRGRKSNQAA